MFIKRNVRRRAGKTYTSILLVQGERVPMPRPPGRPRKAETRSSKVVHRTLANLSKLPEPLVSLIESYCEAERRGEMHPCSLLSAIRPAQTQAVVPGPASQAGHSSGLVHLGNSYSGLNTPRAGGAPMLEGPWDFPALLWL